MIPGNKCQKMLRSRYLLYQPVCSFALRSFLTTLLQIGNCNGVAAAGPLVDVSPFQNRNSLDAAKRRKATWLLLTERGRPLNASYRGGGPLLLSRQCTWDSKCFILATYRFFHLLWTVLEESPSTNVSPLDFSRITMSLLDDGSKRSWIAGNVEAYSICFQAAKMNTSVLCTLGTRYCMANHETRSYK